MQEINNIQIFLSYTHSDQERVLEFYKSLINNGFNNIWIDCKQLLPGQNWDLEIKRSLRKSEIIIFFLSRNSGTRRGYVQRELKIALEYLEEKLSDDTYIIPVKLDSDAFIPDELSKIQYVDLNNPNAHDLVKKSLETQVKKLGIVTSNDTIQSDGINNISISKKVFKEKWEGVPGYEIEFSVPLLSSDKFENILEVSKIIETEFLNNIHDYRWLKIGQNPDSFSWLEDYYQRTNTFEAHYDSIYTNNRILSIKYFVYWYGAGAAHPNHHFETFNFILNPLIKIGSIQSIFKDPEKCFEGIINLVRNALLNIPDEDENDPVNGKKLLDDENWVINGTSDWNSLKAFVFSKEGIEIYFPPYQVGAYVLGSHQITLPYNQIKEFLDKNFKIALTN